MSDIETRITKDIRLFGESIKRVDKASLSDTEARIVKLSEMYAKDADAWLLKKDYYTSFSSIAYAHGLLDAILRLKRVID